MQLTHVIQALSPHHRQQNHRPGSSLSSGMEPEYFQYLLLMLLSIARHRPLSLATVATELADLILGGKEKDDDKEEGGGGEDGGERGDRDEDADFEDKETKVMVDFLNILNNGFWQLYVLRCSNPAVSPVINPGLSLVT